MLQYLCVVDISIVEPQSVHEDYATMSIRLVGKYIVPNIGCARIQIMPHFCHLLVNGTVDKLDVGID